jgi:hypothetical protein
MIVSGYDIPDKNVEGILWAHEFGHTKGLNHRPDANALMNPTAATGHTVVNESECAAMVSPPTFSPRTARKGVRFQAQSDGESIKDFVHHNSGQLDILAAKKYGSSSIPELVTMLNSPEEKHYSTVIIKLLGILGDDETVGTLTDYLRTGSGEITPSEYRAKMASILSIGYLANSHYVRNSKDSGGPALQFLTKVTSPGSVDQLIGEWRLKGQDEHARDSDVIRTAILALGVSGTPLAADLLDTLAKRTQSFGLVPGEVDMSDVIKLAKQENVRVKEDGLVGYYQKKTE